MADPPPFVFAPLVARGLADKLYEKRKVAALEVDLEHRAEALEAQRDALLGLPRAERPQRGQRAGRLERVEDGPEPTVGPRTDASDAHRPTLPQRRTREAVIGLRASKDAQP